MGPLNHPPGVPRLSFRFAAPPRDRFLKRARYFFVRTGNWKRQGHQRPGFFRYSKTAIKWPLASTAGRQINNQETGLLNSFAGWQR